MGGNVLSTPTDTQDLTAKVIKKNLSQLVALPPQHLHQTPTSTHCTSSALRYFLDTEIGISCVSESSSPSQRPRLYRYSTTGIGKPQGTRQYNSPPFRRRRSSFSLSLPDLHNVPFVRRSEYPISTHCSWLRQQYKETTVLWAYPIKRTPHRLFDWQLVSRGRSPLFLLRTPTDEHVDHPSNPPTELDPVRRPFPSEPSLRLGRANGDGGS